MADSALIQVESLSKAFGLRVVLRGVSFKVGRGELIALLGANGSGKTTLLRILATLSQPSGGSVVIGGWQLPKESAAVRGQLGVVTHLPLLYDDLSAMENLRLYAELYNLPQELGTAALQARLSDSLARVGLAKRTNDRVRTFSRGMQQRLALARAVLHDPAILLLDEPYTGLDAHGSALLDSLIAEWQAQGRTIIAALHDLPRAAALCKRALILGGGKLAADLPMPDPESLIATFNALTPS
ncbi:MAG: heme ABC exporter ATP-binding protein CcmA [Chloroflexi bacterium CFX4]|nr:heme ABC exporter ATP-binding protein CcmA [Chloroflexi bacterium CFX4]MDL1921231.1 heme ABC exporter ATP-binding protein CcmA [Chloroflexi bacterium CFX3]